MADEREVIPYATPDRRASYWGAAILCGTALGLILCAGCFTVGILLMTGKSTPWKSRETLLAVVLYASCLGCFSGAVAVLILGIRKALK